MIAFLDISFLSQRRRAEQIRRARRLFAWSALLAGPLSAAGCKAALDGFPLIAAGLICLALAAWLLNGVALSRLRELVREAREKGGAL